MFKEALKKIGLTEGEIQVYEALINLGQTTTWTITKKAKIASSKVYEVLQRLMDKGLASCVVKNGVKNYDATDPKRLIEFLEEKKEKITESQEEIKKIIPIIESKRNAKEEHNQTVVYTGIYGPKIVLKEILEAGKNGIDNIGFGTDVDPYVVYLPYDLERFVVESKKYKFKTRLLFAEGFKSPNSAAEIKHLPIEYLSPIRTMIYGDKIAIVDFNKSVTTIIIHNREIAESYRKHFELLWKIAKK
jgi:sugar-specific transcriptional regulator TrmB